MAEPRLKGTDQDPGEGPSGETFIIREAEHSGEESEGGEEGSDGSDLSDLFDEVDDGDQGNHLALFWQQQKEEDDQVVTLLKRKHVCTPEAKSMQALSPRLDAMTISPPRTGVAKKRLFKPGEDSGVGLSESNEAEDNDSQTQVPPSQEARTPGEGTEGSSLDNSGELNASGGSMDSLASAVLRSSNVRATMLAEFKEEYTVSYTELVRQFKSDKTCCTSWVITIFGITEALYLSLQSVLPEHCTYTHMQLSMTRRGGIALIMVEFKATKNRVTIYKLLKTIGNIPENIIMCDPPKIRSPAAAMYWVQRATTKAAETTGNFPPWIAKQTLISHMTAEANQFDFGQMVQWAYDNDYTDEAQIAYQYAICAEDDSNARAWLMLASQAKHVRDCAVMVRYYKQAQMHEMSMSQWIWHRCGLAKGEGSWKKVVQLLRTQDVEIIPFLGVFRDWLRGMPKKNCICIYGPPNSGKSMFCVSLMRFMRGAVLSYVNSASHFWLQPLLSAKVALLDDATGPCWTYIDVYMRNMLDGNPLSIDQKHKAPVQATCPPMLITSNINITENDTYKYLHSRVKCFHFPCPLQLGADGRPTILLNDACWKDFFHKFERALELEPPQEEEDEVEDGGSQRTFRCSARGDSESL